MGPNSHPESRYPAYPSPFRSAEIDLTSEPHPWFSQHPFSLGSDHTHVEHRSETFYDPTATASIPVGTVPTWGQGLVEHDFFPGKGPDLTGMFSPQPQRPPLTFVEKAVQTTHLSLRGEGESYGGMERRQVHRQPTLRSPIPQEIYTLKKPAGYVSSDVIEFFVNGEEGIRLLDALEENWIGFERRDDRSLFEADRLQIILRLRPVGCPSWKSTISTLDFNRKHQPITRMKLAMKVARSVHRFIEREKSTSHGCRWGGVSLKNVFLTRLVRVSAASWQPEIFVELPSVESQPTGSS